MPNLSILDLLTYAPKGGHKDKDSYALFESTLATLFRAAGASKHPRLSDARKKLGAVTAALYAAYTDIPLTDVCEMTGQSQRTVRKVARELEVPTTRKELTDGLQAVLISTIFERDAAGLFHSFQSLSSAVEAGSKRVEEMLADPNGDMEQACKLLERLTRLSLPFMYLYRDTMDPRLERKVEKWMRKDWTRTAVRELTALDAE